MARFAGLLGIIVLLSLAYIFSTNRKAIKLKTVLWGMGLQFLFAILVFRLDIGAGAMHWLGAGITKFLAFSFAGSKFVFGPLGTPPGEPGSMGFYFVFQVLPTIIFISAFFALMYYLGIMQLIIRALAWAMTRVMGITGAESLNVAASIFMGQTEAPLTIRPFLPECTRSELMTIMTAG
ncbi:MAG TPA: Na+ dependent nucleoside transporter N-terminal domain-containing protein, partial [Candidatus Angelobacter sp.]|nr:Na+ dependent nucleoside transporter N-terminal domain-containing protein [Candidatus Angelobacter sp.]